MCMVNARHMLQVHKLILEALASELQGKKKNQGGKHTGKVIRRV